MLSYNRITVYLLLVAALSGSFWLFSPGTSGGFLMDDSNNLQGLAIISADPGLQSALAYVFNGLFSAIGRPISLATFAAQHADWPANPGAFKTVNILIHVLNGLLVFFVFSRLIRLREGRTAPLWIPLIATALWLVHPLQLSTVLYVVQRMTELSALFVLLGLLLYLHGRESGLADKRGRAWLFMSLGIAIGLGLGVLSKENAALMPLLVLVTEYTLLTRVPRPDGWKTWSAAFLVLPVLLLVGYLASKTADFQGLYALRDFTFSERMFTEARILFNYLGKILLPTPGALGLLFDDFPLSRSLFNPFSTLFAVIGIIGLIGGAVLFRHRQPVLAFAILWFFSAHLLESSVIPLELYYEHRNYLAMLGPLLAVTYYAGRLLQSISRKTIRATVMLSFVAYFGMLALITAQEARLWGNPLLQAATWAQRQPDSARISYLYAGEVLNRGHADKAAELYRQAANRWPDNAVPLIAELEARCYLAGPVSPQVPAVIDRLERQPRRSNEIILFLSRLANVYSEGDCPTLTAEQLLLLIDTVRQNPHLNTHLELLLRLDAQVYEASGQLPEATTALLAAFRKRPRLKTALDITVLYARQQELLRAREFLLEARDNPRIGLREKRTMAPTVEAVLEQLAATE